MSKTLGQIAHDAAADYYDQNHDAPFHARKWAGATLPEREAAEASASAVIDECARKLCSYCAAGHEVRLDPEFGDWIHNSPHISGEAVECDANAILSLKSDMCHERSEQADKSVSAPPLQSGADREAWQPIGTAPVDGTPVLVGYDHGHYGSMIMSFIGFVDGGSYRKPTHWMPLPQPPQAATKTATGEAPSSQTLEAE